MIIAGITGSIGTGKSTVAAMFAELGAYVIDADKLARQAVEPGKQAWKQIVQYFGEDILNGDQTVCRQRLADLVFNDPASLQKLNAIVHPEVLQEDNRLVEERRRIDPRGVILKDIPLLLEGGREAALALVDKIIVVYASPETQLNRLIARGMGREDALCRVRSQRPVSEKTDEADYVIDNDGALEDTRAQVRHVYDLLTRSK
jgi:dephospho-CoA kinase